MISDYILRGYALLPRPPSTPIIQARTKPQVATVQVSRIASSPVASESPHVISTKKTCIFSHTGYSPLPPTPSPPIQPTFPANPHTKMQPAGTEPSLHSNDIQNKKNITFISLLLYIQPAKKNCRREETNAYPIHKPFLPQVAAYISPSLPPSPPSNFQEYPVITPRF